MKIIIVGCGRLGSGLAMELDRLKYEVTVISSQPQQFRALGDDFNGHTLTGVEFDRELLEKAGIMRTDGLITCTESDETNALVARIARNHYRVPKVIARLYDRRKVDIYNALGIQVIATTQWGIARAKELLTFSHLESVLSIGNTPVEVVRVNIPALLTGRTIQEAFPMNEVRVVALSRGNDSFIPANNTLLQEHDTLYLAAQAEAIHEIRRVLQF